MHEASVQLTAVYNPSDGARAKTVDLVCAAGEKGIVPPGKEGAGKAYHFRGRPFYRIIDSFIDQAGECDHSAPHHTPLGVHACEYCASLSAHACLSVHTLLVVFMLGLQT